MQEYENSKVFTGDARQNLTSKLKHFEPTLAKSGIRPFRKWFCGNLREDLKSAKSGKRPFTEHQFTKILNLTVQMNLEAYVEKPWYTLTYLQR